MKKENMISSCRFLSLTFLYALYVGSKVSNLFIINTHVVQLKFCNLCPVHTNALNVFKS